MCQCDRNVCLNFRVFRNSGCKNGIINVQFLALQSCCGNAYNVQAKIETPYKLLLRHGTVLGQNKYLLPSQSVSVLVSQ